MTRPPVRLEDVIEVLRNDPRFREIKPGQWQLADWHEPAPSPPRPLGEAQPANPRLAGNAGEPLIRSN